MKKIILAAIALLSLNMASFAQPGTGKKKSEPAKQAKEVQLKKPTAQAVSTSTHSQPTTTSAAKLKQAPAKKTNVAASHVKKDGTADKRFSENKHLKKDGTPDKRFKENKKSK